MADRNDFKDIPNVFFPRQLKAKIWSAVQILVPYFRASKFKKNSGVNVVRLNKNYRNRFVCFRSDKRDRQKRTACGHYISHAQLIIVRNEGVVSSRFSIDIFNFALIALDKANTMSCDVDKIEFGRRTQKT